MAYDFGTFGIAEGVHDAYHGDTQANAYWNKNKKPITGAVVGGVAGGMIGGPIGAAAGAGIGYGIGKKARDGSNSGGVDPYSGMPSAPQFTSVLQGKRDNPYLGSNLTARNTYNGADQGRLRAYATSKSPSAWLNMMNNTINADAATARDQAMLQQQQGVATARQNLAMNRGLRGGAGERLQSNALRDMMMARQGIASNAAKARYGAATTEEAQKIATLQALPGLEMQRAQQANQVNQFNVGNILNQRDREQQYKLGMYGQQMSAWGAGQTANAMDRANAKPGGILSDPIGYFGQYT